jgi:hypothetical protein
MNKSAPIFIGTIADNLSKAGLSWGCVATLDRDGRTIFVADAHRDDGRRLVAHADEKLTAFLELETAIQGQRGDYKGLFTSRASR